MALLKMYTLIYEANLPLLRGLELLIPDALIALQLQTYFDPCIHSIQYVFSMYGTEYCWGGVLGWGGGGGGGGLLSIKDITGTCRQHG